jgi:hypothetical protein
MNVEIGAEATLFPEKEYVNGIAVAVRYYLAQKFSVFPCAVIRFLCELELNLALAPIVSVNRTLVEAKLCTFTLECMLLIFNKCPIYTHDDASAKFSINSKRITV